MRHVREQKAVWVVVVVVVVVSDYEVWAPEVGWVQWQLNIPPTRLRVGPNDGPRGPFLGTRLPGLRSGWLPWVPT